MSSNIPKEPGFYPVMYWCECKDNPERSHELRGVIAIDVMALDEMKSSSGTQIRHQIIYLDPNNESIFDHYSNPYGIQLEDLEWGPKIEHPKGGW